MDSSWKSKLSTLRSVCRNARGAALPVALILLAIISLVGGAAVMTTTTDIKIGHNYKTNKEAFYGAGAGLEETRGRLKGLPSASIYVGDPASPADPWWSAYLLTSNSWQTSDDPNYNASYANYIPTTSSHTNTTITAKSLQAGLSYWTKIRHRREYDAEQDGHTTSSPHYFDNDGSTLTNSSAAPGNIIYYGYGNPATPSTPVQFTTAGGSAYEPVDIITGYGMSGNSSQTTETLVAQAPGPPVPGVIYSRGTFTTHGASLSVDGNDNCGVAPPIPPVYTLDPATTVEHGNPTFGGNPAAPVMGPIDIDIAAYINSLKSGATVITSDQNGTNFGSPTNYVTVYTDTSDPPNVDGLMIQNGVGYGALLVDGDLTMGGGFTWNGIVLATGEVTFNGGGNAINIRGAVFGDPVDETNGGIDARYDSCHIKNYFSGSPQLVLSWRHVY
jgi:Tfp pilus assembly protein PilX